MNEQHAITIENMTIDMSVGIYDHEKTQTQAVILSLHATTTQHGAIRDLSESVCYHTLYKDIHSLCQTRHFEMLEELAEEISNLCFARQNIHAIRLNLKKPDAIEGTTLVGIELLKSRA